MLACTLLSVCSLPLISRAQTSESVTENVRAAGTVRDPAGGAIEGAIVTLTISNGAESLAVKRVTNAAGDFDFGEQSATRGLEWRMKVSASGFASYEGVISTRDGSAATLAIVLAPASVKEEVVVSAARTATRLDETPASVVVINREQLATTAAVTIDDALRQVPGFQLFRRTSSRTANPTTQGVSLRGTGASGASRALVLADGVPLTDPFGGWVYWGRVPRESVARLEVLRGAASDLYGSGALGGVVSIEKRTTDAPFSLSLETSYGTLSTPDASVWIGGRRGQWGASIAAEAFRTDGYVTVAESVRGRVDTAVVSRRKSGEGTVERFFDANRAGLNRLSLRAETYGEDRRNGTPLQTNSTGLRQFSFSADGAASVVDNYSLRLYGGTQTYDQSFSSIAANRNSETLTRLQRVPAQVSGASGQASRAFAERHTVVVGFDAREVCGASDEIIFVGNRAISLVGAGGRERTFGVFASDISRVGDRLILSGAVRFDRWRNYRALNATRSLATSVATATSFPERIETAFSPRASALLRVAGNVSLAASVARAFRQPTLNELYRAFRVGNVLTLANADLNAERATNGEAGAVFNFLDNRFTARTTVFLTEITRPIANVTLGITPALITRQRQNLGRTRSRGFEAEAEARLTGNLVISGGYLFVNARVAEFPASRDLEGLRLPQVARHQGTFQVRYTNPRTLTFGLQARALGAQFDDDQNLFRLRPAFTLDALVSRRIARQVEVFAAAENLTNSRYDIGRTPVLTIAPPAFVRFGVRVRYGAEK